MFFWSLLTFATILFRTFVAASPTLGLSESEFTRKLDKFIHMKDLNDVDEANDMLEFIGSNNLPTGIPWNQFKEVTNQIFECLKAETLRQPACKAFEKIVSVDNNKYFMYNGRRKYDIKPYMYKLLENINEASRYLDQESLLYVYKSVASIIEYGYAGNNLRDHENNYAKSIMSVPNEMIEEVWKAIHNDNTEGRLWMRLEKRKK
ncbi:hypothetical protein ROZALSC1DRAFT_25723 [Rozella allomycis CSF55]|uniref:Uncharacterized protein n=1 Tax=Rozella allomycis (strain CSF55) TaxID=988480 RepID=A0A4P9YB25_ROZAC|nr:hypothetical protein ROZALSC1DRAFT_25723 [Rozella allomycis CSF55]